MEAGLRWWRSMCKGKGAAGQLGVEAGVYGWWVGRFMREVWRQTATAGARALKELGRRA